MPMAAVAPFGSGARVPKALIVPVRRRLSAPASTAAAAAKPRSARRLPGKLATTRCPTTACTLPP